MSADISLSNGPRQPNIIVLPPRTTVASVPTTPPDPTDTLVFPITNVKSATYLVRIQIDGAESVPASNTTGFTGPTITV